MSVQRKKSSAAAVTTTEVLIKRASQLRGLTFGNKIDELLQGGLSPNSMAFLYGKHANRMMNILCGNSIRVFGGRALFIDASNSYDPYLIAEKCTRKKNEVDLKEFMESITVYRAFTCYQLKKLVTKEIEKEVAESRASNQAINSIFVAGIDSVFSEQDNTEAETQRLQLFMASALGKVARDKESGVKFIVASSSERSEFFVLKSDVSIKLYSERNRKDRAMLTKHPASEKRFASIEI
ncbi:MAG TPA: hypothetical protein VFF30_07500 [Nitrososphaerales archaeon]|nr:hypothetical protein [Nitrososphaerales archaeon]